MRASRFWDVVEWLDSANAELVKAFGASCGLVLRVLRWLAGFRDGP